MKYAAIIRAEIGWKVLLVDMEAQPHFTEVKNWGVSFCNSAMMTTLVPLDDRGVSFLGKKNFVQLINPNEPELSREEVAILCLDKARKLGWIKAAQ